MRNILTIVALALVSCSIQKVPPPASETDHRLAVDIHPDNYVSSNAEESDDTAVDVLVRNQSEYPVTVREIAVTALGTPYYSLVPIKKTFDRTLPPGAVSIFKLWSMSTFNDVARKVPNYRPVILEAAIDASTADGFTFREVFKRQVH